MTTESITRKIFVMWGTQNSQDSRPHCTNGVVFLGLRFKTEYNYQAVF